MKICILTHSIHPTKGGSTKYFYEISQTIGREKEHEVTLVCTSEASNIDRIEADRTILVPQIPIPFLGNIFQTIFFGLLSFLKLRGKNFDAYCYESGYIGLWSVLFKFFKKKLLISFSMRYGLKMLINNLKNEQKKMSLSFLVYSIWELIFFINEWIDVHIANRVIVLNNEGKKLWADSGLSANKIYIVPYGIDLSKYHPQARENNSSKKVGIRNRDKTILYLGHLQPMRNVDKLVKAFNILMNEYYGEDIKLLIIGSGPSEQHIKDLVSRLNLSKSVVFIPHINNEQLLNKLINLGDIMVIPHPPGSTALLGAACGLPVVTVKNKGELLGTIDEKLLKTFITLESSNPVLIAKICNELLTDDDKRYLISEKELSAIKGYSWSSISQKCIRVLRGVLEEHEQK
ncbi:MAG: glycosyltransferase family 4 protein [Candidatus Njordarchaeales archaeon]